MQVATLDLSKRTTSTSSGPILGIAGLRGDDRRRSQLPRRLRRSVPAGRSPGSLLPRRPEFVLNQAVGADRLPVMQRQQGQQRPLLGAADWHHHALLHRFELADRRTSMSPTIHPPAPSADRSHCSGVMSPVGAPQRRVSVTFRPQAQASRPTPRAAERKAMIEAQQLTKRYGETVAVDEVSFVVQSGRVTGFLGPGRGWQVDRDPDDPGPGHAEFGLRAGLPKVLSRPEQPAQVGRCATQREGDRRWPRAQPTISNGWRDGNSIDRRRCQRRARHRRARRGGGSRWGRSRSV